MAVPNTTTFSFQDVTTEIYGNVNSGRNLVQCFIDALGSFDNNYAGSKNSLYNFRNYSLINNILNIDISRNTICITSYYPVHSSITIYSIITVNGVPTDFNFTISQGSYVSNIYNYSGSNVHVNTTYIDPDRDFKYRYSLS